MPKKIAAIIAAGGNSQRFGTDKLMTLLNGRPLILSTIDNFYFHQQIYVVAVAVPQHSFDEYATLLQCYKDIVVVRGGQTRTQSVFNALQAVDGCDIVLIHDGARPFVSADIINRCIDGATANGSAVAAIPLTDTVAAVDNNKITNVPDRNTLMQLQTPQAFDYNKLLTAYKTVTQPFSDDSAVYAQHHTVHLVEGSPTNIKITYPDDISAPPSVADGNCLIGNAYDIHSLTQNRNLILGGIKIPYQLGLLGHSDADVLLHAVMGSILNALGEKDIGTHFPDTDSNYKDANSVTLLNNVIKIMKKRGCAVKNMSCTIIAQQPKLSPYIDSIKHNLATLLEIDISSIGLAATTNEKLGVLGHSQAIACLAVCLLKQT